MLTTERKREILDRLRRDGRVVAVALAHELDVSEDTVRRDLREMASEGLLCRVHGGALPVQPELSDFSARKSVATADKRLLAERAVTLIRPRSMVFLDGGTTNEALVHCLPRDLPLTVVTHSPTIAATLENYPTVEVWLIGGKLYRHSMVAVGAVAGDAISTFTPDLFFLGVTAVHAHQGFSTGDPEEAAIKRQISGRSRETWVMATSEKLDAASPCTILPLSGVTGIVVPSSITPEHRKMLEGAGLWMLFASS